MMTMRSAVSEAWRNLASGTSRAVLVAVLLMVGVGGLTVVDTVAVTSLIGQATAYETSGASTLILKTTAGVDGSACARLASVRGVIGAAAVTLDGPSMTLTKLPSQQVPTVRATAGLATILGVAPRRAGVWIPRELADLVGARPDGLIGLGGVDVPVGAVYAHPDDGRRTGLGFAVVEPVPADGTFNECWVRTWPESELTTPLLLATRTTAGANGTEDSAITQWNTRHGRSFDGAARLASRPTRWSWVVAAGIGLLVGLGTTRARRLELASAHHAGVGASSILVTLVAEALVPVGLLWGVMVPVGLWLTRGIGALDRAGVTHLGWWILWSGSVGLLLGTIGGALLTKERHLLRYFKER